MVNKRTIKDGMLQIISDSATDWDMPHLQAAFQLLFDAMDHPVGVAFAGYLHGSDPAASVFVYGLDTVSIAVRNRLMTHWTTSIQEAMEWAPQQPLGWVDLPADTSADGLDDNAPFTVIHVPVNPGSRRIHAGMIWAVVSANTADPERFRMGLQRAGQAFEEAIRATIRRDMIRSRMLEPFLDGLDHGVLLLEPDLTLVYTNQTARRFLHHLTDRETGEVLETLGCEHVVELLTPPRYGLKDHQVHGLDPAGGAFRIRSHRFVTGPWTGGWLLIVHDESDEHARIQQLRLQERLGAVGQLAAGLAHDFNNMLTGILGFAELIYMREDLPKTVYPDLEKIIAQGRRASFLVHQILDFSRQSISNRQYRDLGDFLRHQITNLQQLPPKGIQLEIAVSEEPLPVLMDGTQIQQVIVNLLKNAMDAMPGGGTIFIHARLLVLENDAPPPYPGMPRGHWIHLSVEDDGDGIPPQHLDHIFEPFYTTKAIGKGSGLGLAQVYGIVKQHRGYIVAGSHEDHGTRFDIYLPRMEHP